MKKFNSTAAAGYLAAILMFLLFSTLIGCGDKISVEDDTAEVLVADSVRQFYHAWLADCVNDEIRDTSHWWSGYDPTEELTNLATSRISSAIASPIITSQIGVENLAWGPALVIDFDGGDQYTPKNLMYCLKSASSKGDSAVYHVGIAGTNMISHYDWFTEDLQVYEQVDWAPGGKISAGSMVAVSKIDGLGSNGQTLLEYLQSELSQNSNMIINVADHSLGGALTQVYSSHLKQQLTTSTASPSVVAWVYAGPTAGNDVFAQTLVQQLDGYNAHNNSRDLVPHAWQEDMLAQLCTVYNGDSICGSQITDNNAINGFIEYLHWMANNSVNNYTIPGKPVLFTGENAILSSDDCDGVSAAIDLFWKTGDFNDVYLRMEAIYQQCSGGSDISYDEFSTFFYYLTEMGYQHTSAYLDHFITNQDLKDTINVYVPGATGYLTDADNIDQGKLLIEDALNGAKDTLLVHNITDCNCQ